MFSGVSRLADRHIQDTGYRQGKERGSLRKVGRGGGPSSQNRQLTSGPTSSPIRERTVEEEGRTTALGFSQREGRDKHRLPVSTAHLETAASEHAWNPTKSTAPSKRRNHDERRAGGRQHG